MRVAFFSNGLDHLGVNRIYINNLSNWVRPFVDEAKIIRKIDDALGFDICILSKYSKINDYKKLKQLDSKIKIGSVHPSDLNKEGINKIIFSDFFIVGSIEEQDYYLKYSSKVFRFPQLEIIKQESLKLHTNKDELILGYHGNLEHLEECSISFPKAVEKASKKLKLKLFVMYNLKLGSWKHNRPDVEIEIFDWSFDSLLKTMSKVDIGMVPCVNKNPLDKHLSESDIISRYSKILFTKKGRKNDYSLNFKNTANAGRSFVFHQLKVPVIADFWPSNFEILSDPNTGRLSHTTEGWYKNIIELGSSYQLRQQIADNAYKRYYEIYNVDNWIELFIKFIKKL